MRAPLSTACQTTKDSNLVSSRRQKITGLYNEATKEWEVLPEAEWCWWRELLHAPFYCSGNSKSGRLLIAVSGCLGSKGKMEERMEHESMFVRLQMERCSVVHDEGMQDAVMWLYNLTADLGKKPRHHFRLRERSHLSFCHPTSNKTGEGSKIPCRKMPQQVPRVTKSGAEGVGVMARYPTMKTLRSRLGIQLLERHHWQMFEWRIRNQDKQKCRMP